jgi:uncharacterized membrane protein (DUF373 family)
VEPEAAGTYAGGGIPAPNERPPDEQLRSTRWRRLSTTSTRLTEGAQDVVATAVGVTLILVAAGILVTSVVDFFKNLPHETLTFDATTLLDKILLVLILVEIVHTVVLSLRAHTLAPQPFIVVGLVAVIRKILFALSSQQNLETSQMSLYIGMVAVFVASLVAVQLLAARRRTGPTGEDSLFEP